MNLASSGRSVLAPDTFSLSAGYRKSLRASPRFLRPAVVHRRLAGGLIPIAAAGRGSLQHQQPRPLRLLRIRRYDLVVISHAALGDNVSTMRRAASAPARRRCPMLVFVGNERPSGRQDCLHAGVSFRSQQPSIYITACKRIAFSPRRTRSICAPILRRPRWTAASTSASSATSNGRSSVSRNALS